MIDHNYNDDDTFLDDVLNFDDDDDHADDVDVPYGIDDVDDDNVDVHDDDACHNICGYYRT